MSTRESTAIPAVWNTILSRSNLDISGTAEKRSRENFTQTEEQNTQEKTYYEEKKSRKRAEEKFRKAKQKSQMERIKKS